MNTERKEVVVEIDSLYIDFCTLDEAIEVLVEAKKNPELAQYQRTQVKYVSYGDEEFGVLLYGFRPETDAEIADRVDYETRRERADYERLKAKFEPIATPAATA
jgi:hypothetical protein